MKKKKKKTLCKFSCVSGKTSLISCRPTKANNFTWSLGLPNHFPWPVTVISAYFLHQPIKSRVNRKYPILLSHPVKTDLSASYLVYYLLQLIIVISLSISQLYKFSWTENSQLLPSQQSAILQFLLIIRMYKSEKDSAKVHSWFHLSSPFPMSVMQMWNIISEDISTMQMCVNFFSIATLQIMWSST